MKKVEINAVTGCWLWMGTLYTEGNYARFWDGTRMVKGHRWAYEHFVGSIPDELQLDHLCRVRQCVNPNHLEPVTSLVNTLRGESVTAHNARKTHCIRDHELSGDNVYLRRNPNGRHSRQCRECIRERDLERRERSGV